MENFIVSARKYRPATFKSVVGQYALTTTLKNAIKSNHLAHAYLFCGPRGVGKTTCARIFAKTINCENLTPDFEACNECESCKSFNEQRSYNIHELDAASNNGVDDIRSLIDQVRIPPQIGKYSVYIVDEVHMLSQGAFNAFLKTLEEPPAHAVFILATTEKHKIIPTILSRCQIYDFNRITVADTVKHLQYVASSENVTVDINGLNVIAQKSDGGMRDALSIFDQLVSFCGNNITYQGVIDNLNVLDYEYYFRLTDCFLNGNVSQSLMIFNEIINKGFDAHHFITGLSSHLRDILVSSDPETIELLEVGADIGLRYQQQAAQCPPEFIFNALKISNQCDLDYRLSKNKRLLVELALIRLCQLSDKKKTIVEELKPPISKISVSPTVTETVKHVSEAPVVTKVSEPAAVPEVKKIVRTEAATPVMQRPVSISINRPKVQDDISVVAEASVVSGYVADETYTDEAFAAAWKSFTVTIPDQVRVVSFMQNYLPLKTGENTYEIEVSNVMQESEMKKILPDILQHLYVVLKSRKIKFIVKITEETEFQRTMTPEEKYKQFVEMNPVVEKLRKNLQMEID